jgi:hypothetical protein
LLARQRQMDPPTSVLALLVVGYAGGLLGDLLRAPRVILQIALGVALAPAVHKTLLRACACADGAVSPASTLRKFALLVAIARGGLSVEFAAIARAPLATLVGATLPFALEVLAGAAAARALLPAESGLVGGSEARQPTLLAYLAASLWAPVSPSIVVPNMLALVNDGLASAGGFALLVAPLEVGTAVVTYGVLEGAQRESVHDGGNVAGVLKLVPVEVFGSVAYGAAFAALFWALLRTRSSALGVRMLGGAALPEHEPLLLFLPCYLLSYVSTGDRLVPNIEGLFAALSCAIGVRYLCADEVASKLLHGLKVVWSYAECFLFTLTGAVIYSAIEAKSPAFSGAMVGVLVCGSLARLAGSALAALAWQLQLHGRAAPRAVALRALFLWSVTTPKATVQASLGSAPSEKIDELGLEQDTADFIAESAAFAILWSATVGSLLTATLGKRCARALEELDGGSAAAAVAASPLERRVGLLAPLELAAAGERQPLIKT